MLINFSGEHTGKVTMFGDVAVQLLKMMGMSGNPEGAILEGDIAAALKKLQSALADLPEPPADNDDENKDDHTVSLQTRATPLIDLLEQCIEQGGHFTWQQQ